MVINVNYLYYYPRFFRYKYIIDNTNIMSRNVSESKKKAVAGKQFYKCANEPKSKVIGLTGYKCPLWAKPGKEQGSFDEAGYEIDHIVEHSISKDDKIKNLQALCKMCHTVKTKRFLRSNSDSESDSDYASDESDVLSSEEDESDVLSSEEDESDILSSEEDNSREQSRSKQSLTKTSKNKDSSLLKSEILVIIIPESDIDTSSKYLRGDVPLNKNISKKEKKLFDDILSQLTIKQLTQLIRMTGVYTSRMIKNDYIYLISNANSIDCIKSLINKIRNKQYMIQSNCTKSNHILFTNTFIGIDFNFTMKCHVCNKNHIYNYQEYNHFYHHNA